MQLPAGGAGGLTVDIGAGAANDRPPARAMELLAGVTNVAVGAGTADGGAGAASERTPAIWVMSLETLKVLMEAPGATSR